MTAPIATEPVDSTFPDVLDLAPLTRPIDATARLPGSKSITNRALLVAALADGPSELSFTLYTVHEMLVADLDLLF